MMVRVTKYHALIASRLVSLLSQALQYPPHAVTTADFEHLIVRADPQSIDDRLQALAHE